MNTVEMMDLVKRCNQLKRFRDECKNMNHPRLSLTNTAKDVLLDEMDTTGLIDQVRDIVRTKIDALEYQIRQLVGNESSS